MFILALSLWMAITVSMLGLLLLVCAMIFLIFFKLWFRTSSYNVPITFGQLVRMIRNKISCLLVVDSMIEARQARITLSCDEVEQAFMRGAKLPRVIKALKKAKREDKSYTFAQLVDADIEIENSPATND